MEGGADTTASYLNSLHLAMVTNPDIQRKAHEEIDRVIGSELPGLGDIERLPYIRAIIKEVLRWRPAAPLGLPHATTGPVHVSALLYIGPKMLTRHLPLVQWVCFAKRHHGVHQRL